MRMRNQVSGIVLGWRGWNIQPNFSRDQGITGRGGGGRTLGRLTCATLPRTKHPVIILPLAPNLGTPFFKSCACHCIPLLKIYLFIICYATNILWLQVKGRRRSSWSESVVARQRGGSASHHLSSTRDGAQVGGITIPTSGSSSSSFGPARLTCLLVATQLSFLLSLCLIIQ